MAEEDFFRGNNKAMMQKSRTWDKEVGCSCLVFKREKAVSFCGARSLSADNKSHAASRLAMGDKFEIAGFGER
ncbi:MAG TPA: hypothetical protein DD438_13775 [Verrucomicrobiales bacterium]|nr:hypothetical protein [Verrucomicrobiales bacterium]